MSEYGSGSAASARRSGTVTALDGVDPTAGRGRVLGLCGPGGAGTPAAGS